MDTKTTEWKEELTHLQTSFAAEHMGWFEQLEKLKAFISSLLHQSRTELMRKVVGVVGKKLCPFHTEYNNCCNECAMFLPHNLNHSALIKLAEEEGIDV